MMSIAYYLEEFGLEHGSMQAKQLRQIVLSGKTDSEIIVTFKSFVLAQEMLYPDTVSIINKSLMAGYGSEYLGLGGDDFSLKSDLFKEFINRFPDQFSMKFYYADCCLIAGKPIDEIYPVLKSAMLQDKENINYPSADLFAFIYASTFSFDFDMLLLDKYYQPCEREEFEGWISEFRDRYTQASQQEYLDKLKWKGDAGIQ